MATGHSTRRRTGARTGTTPIQKHAPPGAAAASRAGHGRLRSKSRSRSKVSERDDFHDVLWRLSEATAIAQTALCALEIGLESGDMAGPASITLSRALGELHRVHEQLDLALIRDRARQAPRPR